MKRLLLLLLYLVLPLFLFAQNTSIIKGIVTDKKTGEPLPGVNVFISGTFNGTTTDVDGKFELNDVTSGGQTLVISMVGYEQIYQPIEKSKKLFNKTIEFKLKEKTYELDKVNVVVDEGDWKYYYEKFVREFIGEREFADECKILNPFAIDFVFDEENQILKAYCDSLLIIENWALGYKISILMQEFTWYLHSETKLGTLENEFFFTYLTPKDEDQQKDWIENRKSTYKNSPRCFFKSLISKKIDLEKYYIRRVHLDRLKKNKIYFDEKNNVYHIPFQYSLNVIILYGFTRHSSFLRFPNKEIVLRKSGIPLNIPENVVISGYWAKYRISDALPSDYNPIRDREE